MTSAFATSACGEKVFSPFFFPSPLFLPAMNAAVWRKKILKQENPDALEQSVAQALHDLEKSVDAQQRTEIRDLTFLSASEIEAGNGKKVILVVVPYVLLNNYRRLHHILATNLEKKLRYNQILYIFFFIFFSYFLFLSFFFFVYVCVFVFLCFCVCVCVCYRFQSKT
jgi:hypothetical protein